MQQRVRAIIIEEGKCLFIRRIKGDDEYWVFPGGGVEDHDADLEAALKRECLEELGVEVEVGEFFTKTYFSLHGEEQEQHIFYCRVVSGELGTGQGPEFQSDGGYEGIYEVEWVDIKEMGTKNILPEELKEMLTRGLYS